MSAGNRGFYGFSSDESGNNVSMITFAFPGVVNAYAASLRFYNSTNRNFSIQKVTITCNTPSGSGAITGNVWLNGVSIFINAANKPTLAQGAVYSENDLIENRDWNVGDYLQAGIDAPGSGAADCVIQVVYQ